MQLDKLLRQTIIWRGFYLFSTFFVTIFLSRTLHSVASGMVFYFANLFALFVLIFGLSLESAFTYFLSSKKISIDALVSMGIIWVGIISIPVVGILVYVYHYYLPTMVTGMQWIIYGMMFIVGNILYNYFAALFYALNNFFLPNFLSAVLNIFLLFFLLASRVTSETIFFIFFLTNFLQGIIVTVAFMVNNQLKYFKINLHRKDIIAVMQFAVTALGANIIFFLLYRIDYWLVQRFCAPSDLGNYIQASKMGQAFLFIPQIFATTLFPVTARYNNDMLITDTLLKLFRLLMQLFVLLFIVFFFAGNWIFAVLLGQDFLLANRAFMILLPGIFCLSMLSLLSSFFGGKNSVHINLRGALVGLTVLLIGNLFLMKHYSIEKAALMSSVGYATNFLFAMVYFRKLVAFQVTEIFKWKIADWIWLKKFLFQLNK